MTPADEQELSEAVASASAPLAIIGGGTRPIGKPVAADPLHTSGLEGIKLYEPSALTILAGAGTPLDLLEDELEKCGQRLPFEPMDHRGLLGTTGVPTIGGVVAANVSGPRRVQVGSCRDYLLGVRFVNGEGTILKSGGKVMKDVTGYDLVKLLAGSYGTLGVLSEVAFKVLPSAEARAVLLIENLSDVDAIRSLSRALCSQFEVTGAAHVPEGLDGNPVTMIRLEGFEESVRYRSERLRDELREFGEINIERSFERTMAGWKWIRDVEKFHGKPGDVWRFSVKPTNGPKIAERIRSHGPAEIVYDWGGGLVWALVSEGTDLRGKVGGFSGHATLTRASRATRSRLPVFQPQFGHIARITEGLRQKFDPRGILNPGLMA